MGALPSYWPAWMSLMDLGFDVSAQSTSSPGIHTELTQEFWGVPCCQFMNNSMLFRLVFGLLFPPNWQSAMPAMRPTPAPQTSQVDATSASSWCQAIAAYNHGIAILARAPSKFSSSFYECWAQLIMGFSKPRLPPVNIRFNPTTKIGSKIIGW